MSTYTKSTNSCTGLSCTGPDTWPQKQVFARFLQSALTSRPRHLRGWYFVKTKLNVVPDLLVSSVQLPHLFPLLLDLSQPPNPQLGISDPITPPTRLRPLPTPSPLPGAPHQRLITRIPPLTASLEPVENPNFSTSTRPNSPLNPPQTLISSAPAGIRSPYRLVSSE